MSKDKTPEVEATNPDVEPVKVEDTPKKPQAVIKVVEITVDQEYTEPEGWLLKEIHSVDVASGKFFGVLVKIQEMPKPAGMRMGPRVPLKKER